TDINHAQRYCNNLNDLREIHSYYGRSRALEASPKNPNEAKETISRVAETFGGVDIFVDAQLLSLQEQLLKEKKETHSESFNICHLMTEAAEEFLKGRSRGRIIYLYHYLLQESVQMCDSSIENYIRKKSQDYKSDNVTVNGVALGACDEFLLCKYPNVSVSEALKKLNEDHPLAGMVDSYDVANLVSFLASPLSSAITGQTIHVTNGLDL
ncbi:MAG: SDR family oxidoreductase, partial [Bdellovibrionales bacterium]|nr:SDR family oxidoreductase [Bdellovibrionales bacterium]